MRFHRLTSIAAVAVAAQLMLGCHSAEPDDAPPLNGVEVPASTDHPSELVGKWAEAKGKQTIELRADGSCEMTNQISMGPAGAATSSEQKVSAKWGTKDGKFFFSDIQNSLPLSYDWKIQGGKLQLTNNGSKLSYSQVKEAKK